MNTERFGAIVAMVSVFVMGAGVLSFAELRDANAAIAATAYENCIQLQYGMGVYEARATLGTMPECVK